MDNDGNGYIEISQSDEVQSPPEKASKKEKITFLEPDEGIAPRE